MSEEIIEKIYAETESEWEGDNAFQGLQIIAKYIDPTKNDIIQGADHDVIYSVDGQDLLDAGITKKDLKALFKLNWSYEDSSFKCFV